MNAQIEEVITLFSRIYLGGIPATITDDSAFCSFVCVLSATEALAGYYHGKEGNPGSRFKTFVKDYFPKEYTPLAEQLWEFRNSVIHAFAPKIGMTHHHSERHFFKEPNGTLILNAEDFYAHLLISAQRFFADVRTKPELQGRFLERLTDIEHGGSVSVRLIELT